MNGKPVNLCGLFPVGPEEEPADYAERLEAIAGAVADAVNAYHREFEVLALYAPGGPWRDRLRRFVEGRLPFHRLPAGLQEDLRGRLRCSFLPTAEEPARDGREPWCVLQVIGDPIEGMDAGVRAYQQGLPPRQAIEDEEAIRERAREFLSRPLNLGLRSRPRETALCHLIFNLGVIWRGGTGVSAYSGLAALAVRALLNEPGRGPGRPMDGEASHRVAFVTGVLRGVGLPAPSARVLRRCLPSLHTPEDPRLYT
jgi:hypothetical protein